MRTVCLEIALLLPSQTLWHSLPNLHISLQRYANILDLAQKSNDFMSFLHFKRKKTCSNEHLHFHVGAYDGEGHAVGYPNACLIGIIRCDGHIHARLY